MASETKVRANQVRIEEILNDPSAIASTTKAGTLRIATQPEVDAGTATDLAVTPATLAGAIASRNWLYANDGDNFTTAPQTSGSGAITIGDNSISYLQAIAIGGGVTAQQNSVAIGLASNASGLSAVALGHLAQANSNYQVSIGYNMPTGSPEYSVRIGYAQADVNLNYLRLRNKGQFEIFGDQAQFVLPNYFSGGSPALPTSAIEGALVYDASTKELRLHDGVSWSAISGLFSEDGNRNIVGGTGAGASLLGTATDNFLAGYGAGDSITSGDLNVAIGKGAGGNITTTNRNVAIGAYSMYRSDANVMGDNNVCIGGFTGRTLRTANSDNNVFIGDLAGSALTGISANIQNNVGIGVSALTKVTGGGNSNIAIGKFASANVYTGSYNVGLGESTLRVLDTGDLNLAIGHRAGYWLDGASSSNVVIGPYSGPTSSTVESNKLYINNAASATPLIGGDFATSVGSPLTGQVTIRGNFTVDSLLTVTSGAAMSVSAVTNYENLVTADDDIPNKKYVDDSIAIGGGAAYLDQLLDVALTGSPAPQFGDALIYSAAGSPVQWVHAPAIKVDYVDNNIYGGDGAGASFIPSTSTQNVLLGRNAGSANIGARTVIIGDNAGANLTGANLSTLIGAFAGEDANAGGGTALGAYAGRYATGTNGVHLGRSAGRGNPAGGSGASNVFVGESSGLNFTTGGSNTAIGVSAGRGITTGSNNVAVGRFALFTTSVSGDYNTVIGPNAAYNITSGDGNVVIGRGAGPTSNTANQLFIDSLSGFSGSDTPLIHGNFSTDVVTINGEFNVSNADAGSPSRFSEIRLHDNVNNAVTVISNAPLTGSPTGDTRFQLPADNGLAGRFLQTDGSGNTSWQVAAGSISVLNDLTDVTLGSPVDNQVLTYSGGVWSNGTPAAAVFTEDAQDNIYAGTDAGLSLTAGAADNFFAGVNAGRSITSGDDNVFIGQNAGQNASTAFRNVFIGLGAGVSSGAAQLTASRNVGIGDSALNKIQTSATQNTAVGGSAGYGITTGVRNTMVGISAGSGITTGTDNVCVGRTSGTTLGSGSNNVMVGRQAGSYIGGSNNIVIGPYAGTLTSATSDKLFINTSTSDTPLIGGDFSAKTVTINGVFNVSHVPAGSPSSEIHLHDNVNGAVTVIANAPLTGSPTGDTRFQLPADNGQAGRFLQTDGSGNTSWQIAAGSVSVLNDLTDVTMGSPVEDQVLTYSGGTWTNAAAAGGGAANEVTFTFSTATGGVPATSNVRLDTTSFTSTTALYFDDTSLEGLDIGTMFGNLSVGDQIYLKQDNDNTKYAFFVVDGYPVDNTGYWTVPVADTDVGTLADNGATVGIIKMPGQSLGRFRNNLLAGIDAGNPSDSTGGANNICIGDYAGSDLSGTGGGATGNDNVIIGPGAGRAITTGDRNVIIGDGAAGNSAVSSNARDYIFIGRSAGFDAVGGSYGGIAIGRFAGRFENGFANISIGDYAGKQATGMLTSAQSNISIGRRSGGGITSGDWNTFVGEYAGTNITTGTGNVCIGRRAGPTTDVSQQLFIDYNTSGFSNTPLIHGDFSTNDVTINGDLTVTGTLTGGGTSALHDLSDVQGTGSPTPTAGDVLTYVSGSPTGYWTASAAAGGGVGSPAEDVIVDQYRNVVGVVGAGDSMTASAVDNVILGFNAGNALESGKENVFIGLQAGQYSVNGSYAVLIGKQAGKNNGNSFHNIGIGNASLGYNSAGVTGSYNIGIGLNSLDTITSGAYNTVVGHSAGKKITTGAYNTCLGYGAGPTTNQSNQLYINKGESDTPLIHGNFTTGVVTINSDLNVTNLTVTGTATGVSSKPLYEQVVVGSPISNVINTTIPTVGLTGSPSLEVSLLVYRNGILQDEDLDAGSPALLTEDYMVTGANQITFADGLLQVGGKVKIIAFT